MSSQKASSDSAPEGSIVLLFVQMFSTLGYAVLQSTLVLYATKHLHFTDELALSLMGVFGAFNYGLHLFGGYLGYAVLQSTLVLYATKHLHFTDELALSLMGVFGAFNYGLHLFGGYLGGRFLSNRNLFVGGMVLQVLGCACIAGGSATLLYWGLALFLTGSGLNVTCINMMLTQRFSPEDPRRESAFLFNYAGMNIGFFVGFTVAGWFQESQNYPTLFTFATLGNAVAIALALFYWRTLADRKTPLLEATPQEFRVRFAIGVAILIGLVPLVWKLLQLPDFTEIILKVISAFVFTVLLKVTLGNPDRRERRNMVAYLILAVGSLVFWSLYQMSSSGLSLYFDRNVNPIVMGITIQTQWVQNINTFVIAVGGPLLAIVFTRLRDRGWRIDVPRQFATALVLMGLGFLALPLGISLADPATGRAAFFWIFLSYFLQSLGELLISPVGYAMIGKLAPHRYQGVMMGAWMLITGLASLFAGDLSKSIPTAQDAAPQVTNAYYSMLFGRLGWGTVAVGILLALLIPFLRKLISDKDTPEVDQLAPAVLPH